MTNKPSFWDTLIQGLRCKCPHCGKGDLFTRGVFNQTLKDQCSHCGLDFSKNDSADGPAVFLIFILGFSIVPLALILEMSAQPPLWVHVVLWGTLIFALTIGSLKPLKSYIIYLQYKHRPGDWS